MMDLDPQYAACSALLGRAHLPLVKMSWGHHIDFSYSKLDYIICVRITAIVKFHAPFHSDMQIHVIKDQIISKRL